MDNKEPRDPQTLMLMLGPLHSSEGWNLGASKAVKASLIRVPVAIRAASLQAAQIKGQVSRMLHAASGH